MSRLERRCRLLLRAYPKSYLIGRGEEILGTLLDATPGSRSWPPAHDGWSVIMGGLRARAARNRELPLTSNLRLAALLAAALWHGYAVQSFAFAIVYPYVLPSPLPPALAVRLVAAALAAGACMTIASAWFWRRGVTFTLALAMAAASAVALRLTHNQGVLLLDLRLIGPPLALAALAPGKHRPPRSWLWLPGLWLTAASLPAVLSPHWWYTVDYPIYAGIFVVLGISVLWLAADARPAIAVGLCLDVTYLTNILLGPPGRGSAPDAGQTRTLALIAAALTVAALRTRRRATV